MTLSITEIACALLLVASIIMQVKNSHGLIRDPKLHLFSFIILVCSILIIVKAYKDLGTGYSPFLNTNSTELVQTGIYAYVRHPMYTGIILWSVGLLLMFPGILSLLFCIVTIGTLLKCRIPEEETNLITKFGDKYKEYVTKTSSIIPFVI